MHRQLQTPPSARRPRPARKQLLPPMEIEQEGLGLRPPPFYSLYKDRFGTTQSHDRRQRQHASPRGWLTASVNFLRVRVSRRPRGHGDFSSEEHRSDCETARRFHRLNEYSFSNFILFIQ